MTRSTRRLQRRALSHFTQKTQFGGMPYNDDRGGNRRTNSGSRGAIGSPEHAQSYFKNSGFPREYFDHALEDDAYIDITANISPSTTTAQAKLIAKIKLLNYLYHIENKLQVNDDLSDFRRKAIADYRKAVNTQLGPPPVKKSIVKLFNNGGLNHQGNQEEGRSDSRENVSCPNRSYLEFLFGYETTREERKQNRNIDGHCYDPEEANSVDYVKAVEAFTKYSNYDFKRKITARNYHAFKIRWVKVGEVLRRISPHPDYPVIEDPSIEEHPLVTYWVTRHKQIQDYFDTTFKSLKDIALPSNIREEVAVCRADQRQLLMLLCGDVPAEMLVDPRTGQIRNEQQISHHILFLTKPYHMSNTYFGVLMQSVNRFVNTVRHGGKSLAKALGWSLVAIIQAIGLFSAVLVLYRDNYTHIVAQNVFFVLAYLLKTFVHLVLKVTGVSRSELRAYRIVTDVDETMRLLQTLGASYFVWRILWTVEKDVNHNLRLPAMKIPFQRAMDHFNLTRAMLWLAELKPGMFGESTVSGISDEQLGKMQQAQDEMKRLDLDVVKTRCIQIEEYLEKFGKNAGSHSRQMLWADLNTDYRAARSSFVNPRETRHNYMRKYPHEFRAHHFFDAYGTARNTMQIVLAYLCYWQREERELMIPVVPYNDNKLHESLHPDELSPAKKLQMSRTLKGSLVHLNPIQRSEFYRRSPVFSSPQVADVMGTTDPRLMHSEDVKEHTDREASSVYRAHIDINDVFKHERHYTAWLETNLPNNESAQEEFRKIKGGWTHKLSPALRQQLQKEFHLNTRTAVMDYKEFTGRQLRQLDSADTESVETPWYIVGTDNLYSLFTGPHIDNDHRRFRQFVLDVYEKYKDVVNARQGTPSLDEVFLERFIRELRGHQPMKALHMALPVRTQRAVYYHNHADEIKEAVVKILGLYIYTIDEPDDLKHEVDSVLKHRMSAQHREQIGTMFRQQFIAEDEFLKTFVQATEFVKMLKDWYEESNNQLGGGREKHTVKRGCGVVSTLKKR